MPAIEVQRRLYHFTRTAAVVPNIESVLACRVVQDVDLKRAGIPLRASNGRGDVLTRKEEEWPALVKKTSRS
jgi:hypothetical protein